MSADMLQFRPAGGILSPGPLSQPDGPNSRHKSKLMALDQTARKSPGKSGKGVPGGQPGGRQGAAGGQAVSSKGGRWGAGKYPHFVAEGAEGAAFMENFLKIPALLYERRYI